MAKTKKKQPKKASKKINRGKSLTPALFLALLLGLVGLQLVILGSNLIFASSPVTGLRFNNVPVGMPLSPGIEKQVVKTLVKQTQNKPITIQVNQTVQKVSPTDLGLYFDPDSNFQKLAQAGRTGTFIDRLIYQDEAYFGFKNESVAVSSIDETDVSDYVQSLATKIGRAKQNASFGIADGKPTILADKDGLVLDSYPAIQDFQQTLKSYQNVLTLTVIQVKADVTANDLKPILPQVNQLVSTPLVLNAVGHSLALTPEQINSVLVISKPAKDKPTQITFDSGKVNTLLESLAKKVDVSAQPDVTDGTDTLSTGKDGQTLDTKSATKSVLDALGQRETGSGSNNGKVDLPVSPIKHGKIVRVPKTVYLTFDDGPGQATNQILDELSQAGAHATFFLIGYNVANDPGTVRRIVAEGNTVGNHTYDHIDLRPLSPDQIHDELARDQEAIYAACGVYPKVFRAPFSFYSDAVKSAAAGLGMQVMSYTVDTGDWQLPGTGVITSRVLNRVKSGSIVIMHVDQQTADALPGILSGLKAKGYKFKN